MGIWREHQGYLVVGSGRNRLGRGQRDGGGGSRSGRRCEGRVMGKKIKTPELGQHQRIVVGSVRNILGRGQRDGDGGSRSGRRWEGKVMG